MKRRNFIKTATTSFLSAPLITNGIIANFHNGSQKESEFVKKLKPIGRILEEEGYYVWCNTPVYGKDGKIHVFYSRWLDKYGMSGWISKCEIAHAVADSPESVFTHVETILKPRPGFFDATTCHNPHIQFHDGKYYLFYMGNSNGRTNTKRVGLAIADDVNGPWERKDTPLLETGEPGAWDDHCTTNPALLKHPNGQFWLYYKSWNNKEYEEATGGIRGNRKYGLAIADKIEGPYIKYDGNPVIDFSYLGDNQQLEDAYVWFENDLFKLIARDMGFYNHEYGLLFKSKDGLNWNKPEIAYYETGHYFEQPPKPKHLNRYGRLERPQLLMKNGKPEYLFTTSQGGKYNTASGYIFKIE
ncbi:family 43 glycosylhydrolase [Maribellus comscasis]|uniref:Family 43 glycosylhydrolase n=1 Tax=Maribellus comscasis TaxID=2681766 RepID=A0A6I6JNF6_9BACT|nr:glycoside hydrolase family protein [Maribellus comscasis]QGY43971.1 family 43 glycosylhydrolase [Maribellus comscasis]